MTARNRNWALYALAWLPAALLETAVVAGQGQATWLEAFVSAVVLMGVAAGEGVGVWWLTGRLPLPARGLTRFVAAHLALAAVYALIWLGTFIGWIRLVVPGDEWRGVVALAGPWRFISGLWMYGLVAGVSYFFRAQRRVREREVAAARAEAAAAQAQLRSVRAQLNPHFLYNALHSLSTLVRRDPAQAEAAVERLGGLLRYALDEGSGEFVHLADEWAFTQSYLELERLRLGDRLRLTVALDEPALDCLVPPFILQPLVENAVRHGAARRPAGATISVRVALVANRLTLEVRDDGPGADADAVKASTGVGLESLRRLVEARYDGDGSLAVDTAPGRGFTVTLRIPAHPAGRKPLES